MAHHINIGGRQGREEYADPCEEYGPMTRGEIAACWVIGMVDVAVVVGCVYLASLLAEWLAK